MSDHGLFPPLNCEEVTVNDDDENATENVRCVGDDGIENPLNCHFHWLTLPIQSLSRNPSLEQSVAA